MATRIKIKISDNTFLRSNIDMIYEQTTQIALAKWAIQCAKHILTYVDFNELDNSSITQGFSINELWQDGKASVHEVRLAGFKIHEFARKCNSEITKNAVRTAGQAVGVGHMKEHAMVCSDYAIKTIQLVFPNQQDKINEERQWQLMMLIYYRNADK